MANLDVLENKIDNLNSKFDEFLDRYARDTVENKQAHASIKKELYGNGNEGIKFQVMKNTDLRKNISKFIWILISTVTIDLIGLIFLLIKLKAV